MIGKKIVVLSVLVLLVVRWLSSCIIDVGVVEMDAIFVLKVVVRWRFGCGLLVCFS